MEDFWQFVFDNNEVSPHKLRLKYHGHQLGFDVDLAITQIECRRKFGKKFAETLERDPKWLFPSILSGEQATSDMLARYHASLVGNAHSVVDLTSGLGIDVIHFPNNARITAIDIETAKTEALRYNIETLGLTNITTVCADCRDFIAQCDDRFDVAFIDPARRSLDGKRTFALSDCQPDVIALLPGIRRIADKLIIKMSPMLDIAKVASDLTGVERIIALGTSIECKELIAVIDFAATATNPFIEAVTLSTVYSQQSTVNSQSFTFVTDDERSAHVTFVDEKIIEKYKYLYEPSPTIMKAAPYKLLSEKYGIDKLAPNTHIYLSDTQIGSFPGTTWIIEKVLPYESKHIKRLKREYPRIQVATRNFTTNADTLRAKFGVADSDTYRLYAVTTTQGSKYMIICRAKDL